MMFIKWVKLFFLKIIYGYATSSGYKKWLEKKGVKIGENVHFYSPQHIGIDVTRPYAVTIGNNVHITKGVTILTHGFDWSVVKGKYDDVLGSFGEVSIGNNVFIGAKATICQGVHIEDNVIIGACSVVTKDCEPDSVYVGVPARYLCSISEYYQKRVSRQVEEAKALFYAYYRRNNKIPPKDVFSEFFFLFEDRSLPLQESFVYQMRNNGRYSECERKYQTGHRQVFDSYESFIEECMNEYSLSR